MTFVFKQSSAEILYHGSPKLLKEIRPHYSRLAGKEVVFASMYREVALCFSPGNMWKDDDIALGEINGKLYIEELKKDAFKVFDRSGYIYSFSPNGFFSTKGLASFELVSYAAIRDFSTEKVKNIMSSLIESDIDIIYYNG